MPISKQLLRAGALKSVTDRQYAPAFVRGLGIVPGARLRATAGPAAGKLIAVRTSQDREVGLTRELEDRAWRTVSKVQEVLVAVPSLTNPKATIEVLCFDSKVMIAVFDDAVKKAGKRALSKKAPVFVALDVSASENSGALTGGLAARAKWRDEISVASVAPKTPDQLDTSSDGFDALVQRIRRAAAARNGVDATKISIEIRVAV